MKDDLTLLNDKDLYNANIASFTSLLSPRELWQRYPLTEKARATVLRGRRSIEAILRGEDSRPFIIVGPCSIHDTNAALEYANKLASLAEEVQDYLLLVMRVYFEKPRTTTGWKGLINDPDLDDTFDIEKGLSLARQMMITINEKGLAIGTEALDPHCPQYIGDLVSWTAIGARTSESQTHREMSSGLSTPVGFKNGTDGSLEIAINAIKSAAGQHRFLGLDPDGRSAITTTRGNAFGHIVLRGGNKGPNYDSVNVALCEQELREQGLKPNIVVDCSHANSNKDHNLQPLVFQNVIGQIIAGNHHIVGLMLESNLFAGKQTIPKDLHELRYGVSITDACMDWLTTQKIIRQARDELARAQLSYRF